MIHYFSDEMEQQHHPTLGIDLTFIFEFVYQQSSEALLALTLRDPCLVCMHAFYEYFGISL